LDFGQLCLQPKQLFGQGIAFLPGFKAIISFVCNLFCCILIKVKHGRKVLQILLFQIVCYGNKLLPELHLLCSNSFVLRCLVDIFLYIHSKSSNAYKRPQDLGYVSNVFSYLDRLPWLEFVSQCGSCSLYELVNGGTGSFGRFQKELCRTGSILGPIYRLAGYFFKDIVDCFELDSVEFCLFAFEKVTLSGNGSLHSLEENVSGIAVE